MARKKAGRRGLILQAPAAGGPPPGLDAAGEAAWHITRRPPPPGQECQRADSLLNAWGCLEAGFPHLAAHWLKVAALLAPGRAGGLRPRQLAAALLAARALEVDRAYDCDAGEPGQGSGEGDGGWPDAGGLPGGHRGAGHPAELAAE